MLVSNNVAGSIIGRAGQTISELQNESSTRIKLSQSGDYYPSTQDRVCLVQGEPSNIKTAFRLLLERMYMLQESSHLPTWNTSASAPSTTGSFDFVVRLLVPMSCCGMIIGKSGSNIKFMEETAGVTSIRLSPKEAMNLTTERVVTITGQNMEVCLQCVYMVIDGMTSHPDISRYTNMTTSYAAVMANYEAQSQAAQQQQEAMLRQPSWTAEQQYNIAVPRLTRRIESSPELHGGMPSPGVPTANLNPRATDDFEALLHPSSFPPQPSLQPISLQAPSPHSPIQPPISPQGGRPLFLSRPNDRQDHAAFAHSASAPNLLAFHHHPPPPTHISHTNLEYIPPAMIAEGCFNKQILIPDSMIGSILGRGGRTLTEIQGLSGTSIRISQRGEYMPGTRSRIVTIRGPNAQAVWHAECLIQQRMVLPPTAAAQRIYLRIMRWNVFN